MLQAASSVHYHFVVTWRLLGCLPPSARYLHTLEVGSLQVKATQMLHTLRWVPRLAHKAFSGWTKVSQDLISSISSHTLLE